MIKVFVSSTYKELQRERKAVIAVLGAIKTEIGAMEFFGPNPGSPLETSLQELGDCDIYLGINCLRSPRLVRVQ